MDTAASGFTLHWHQYPGEYLRLSPPGPSWTAVGQKWQTIQSGPSQSYFISLHPPGTVKPSGGEGPFTRLQQAEARLTHQPEEGGFLVLPGMPVLVQAILQLQCECETEGFQGTTSSTEGRQNCWARLQVPESHLEPPHPLLLRLSTGWIRV